MLQQYEDIESPPQTPSRGWFIGKILLRAVSIIVSTAIFGLCLILTHSLRYYAEKFHFAWRAAIGSSFEVAPPLAIAIWDIVEFITMCARRGRGVHPGFHVATNLIFWLVCILMVAITNSAASAFLSASHMHGRHSSSPLSDSDINAFVDFAARLRVIAALFVVLIILRFVLFVRACIELHNYQGGSHQVVVLSHTPYYPPVEPQIPLNAYTHVPPPASPSPSQPPPQYYERSQSPTQSCYPPSPRQAYAAPPSPLSGYQFSKAQNF